jgi:hypothetical protein
MADDDWGPLFGLRPDLNLDRRWWHRLSKVAYVFVLALTAVILWLALSQAEPSLEKKNVRITGTLSDVLNKADASVPNGIPAFLALPGRTAKWARGGSELVSVFDYGLERSFCTPDAHRHIGRVVGYLNTREYGANQVTALQVGQDIAKWGPSPRLCWFDSSMTGTEVGSVVMFEFKRGAQVRAWIMVLFWTFCAHAVLLNLYYRGFVYIVCGPRRPLEEWESV